MDRADVVEALAERLHTVVVKRRNEMTRGEADDETQDMINATELALERTASEIFDEIFEPLLRDEIREDLLMRVAVSSRVTPYIKTQIRFLLAPDSSPKTTIPIMVRQFETRCRRAAMRVVEKAFGDLFAPRRRNLF